MGLTKPRAAQIFNLDYKQSTRVVATTNITLTGGAPSLVDGVSLSTGDRILVIAQTTGTQNGLYYVTTLGSGSNGTWARTSDGNENGEIEAGMIVMVTEGVIYADTQWKLITDDPIIINTTALTFIQNYMANSISGGTSNVVVNSNANVTISSAGTANVLLISSTGTVTSGTASVTGNITGGNANITGTTAATSKTTGALVVGGGVGVASDVWAGNSITVDGGSYGNVVTTQFASLYATANGPNPYSIVQVRSNDTTTGMGMRAYAGLNGQIYSNSGISFTTGATIKDKDFPTGGTTRATIDSTGLTVAGIASVTGNITIGNVLTGGLVSATGNITGSYIFGNGSQLTGLPATYGNTNVAAFLAVYGSNTISSTGTITAGNITGGNILTGGLVSATGNVSGNYILGNGASLTGVITSVANINNGTSNVTVVSSGGNITVGVGGTPNVVVFATTGEYVSGLLSVTGNITSGNLSATNITGTLTTASQTNITAVGTLGSLSVSGNTTSGNVSATNYTGTNVSVTGTQTAASTVGGVISGSSISVTGAVNSASASVSGGVSAASVAGGVITGSSISVTGTQTSASTVGGVITGSSASVSGGVTAASVVGGVITGTSTSVTGSQTAASTVGGVITGSSASVSGNVTGANIVATTALTNGNITITGANIVSSGQTLIIDPNGTGGTDGNVIIAGNLSVTGNVTYINSNNVTTNDLTINVANNAATAAAANGGGIGVGPAGNEYISLTYSSSSNVWVASNGLNVQGVTSASGNVTGGNILTGGLISATSDVIAGNVLTGGLISATANITGGNVRTVGQVSATGNVTTDTFFVGNGTYLTGISAAISVTKIENGNSNVWVNTPGGDVTVTAGGVANVAIFSTGSLTLQGAFGTPKTISANIVVAGNINAMLLGPVTFGNNYNLTVPTSSTVYVYAP